MPFIPLISTLTAGSPLTEAQAFDLFNHLLAGRLSEPQITSILAALADRGPSVDELVGAARAMRAVLTPIPRDPAITLIDTCGTGGAPKTFNVSTIVALLIATVAAHPSSPSAPRVQVAKHGNRSRTGRGSAEVLAALGVNIHNSPATQARCLQEIGVCFSFAPDHHPAARHAAAARHALAVPTIFNLLGPLCNPAGAERQLVGVYSPIFALRVAQALARLNTPRFIVVHSHDGLDELTTTAPGDMHLVEGDTVSSSVLDATTLGLPRATLAELQATSLEHAVSIFQEVISGMPGPFADLVLLNAGAALLVAGVTATMADGIELARAMLISGRVAKTLDALIRLSNQDPPAPTLSHPA